MCFVLPRLFTTIVCSILLAVCARAQDSKAADSKEPDNPLLKPVYTSIVITAKPEEPAVDRRNSEVFQQTLFSRDDQVFHQLNAGINAGQHEGGGKSIEVRRFGFNLDHGGVNGGLKVLVDNIQQNQSTQGHGQGYLGALKSLTPELIEDAEIINGPFSAEYGDFSGLGVVHIRMREALPDEWTARIQGGSFNSQRGFLSYSPSLKTIDSYFAYEGSHTDGPFEKPLDYRRDNVTMNVTRRLTPQRSLGFKFNGSRNDFNSSGQIPLNEVDAGRLDRFGYLDPGEGGLVTAGTAAMYFRQELKDGVIWKADAFVGRSLFDLFSNFTYYLNDPVNGDGIQQHDSRLQEGANFQFLKPHKRFGGHGLLTAGGNYHDNQINVGLYSRVDRVPTSVTTKAHARIANGAGYVQETLAFFNGKLIVGGGLRYDGYRFDVRDLVEPANSAAQNTGRFQPKASVAYSPASWLPATLHINYGRGITSLDARSILKDPNGTLLATTDFVQAGLSHQYSRFSWAVDGFMINRSNELAYSADDGTLDFLGPSRAYGFEAKASVSITRKLSLSGGLTKVGNAFYRGTEPRAYVDRAPHFVANAGLTLASWRGWSGSLRVRAINHYRLYGDEGEAVAAGHTVFDLSLVRRISRGVDLNFALDNMLNRDYYETQNFLESRPWRGGPASYSIHATPGYPITATIGLTFRFRGK
ncbi:MAG: TonB-dependent receptor plug domain-containing protein [Bryobacterales bacterium]|nr:TonB-dependent receptor plug domain-containing protein [Bryobacterales bacterium]